MQDDRRHLLEKFQIIGVARKVVGVGSVGTRAFIVLLQGRDQNDPLFLQVKEATASVLEDHLPKTRYKQPGERVVKGQRMMQAASNIYLGWTKGEQENRYLYWRQLRDMKGSAEVESLYAHPPGALGFSARQCAWTLARAHARSAQAPAARFSRKSPAQEVILLSGSDGTRLPDRWIRVEAFVTLRPKSHHFYTPKGHAAAPAGTVRPPSTSELTSSPRWPFPVTWFLRLFAPPARSRPVAAVDPSAGPVNASPERDTSWEAIVEQLRATPSDGEPDQPPESDYAWAGRLGMHINRRPKRR